MPRKRGKKKKKGGASKPANTPAVNTAVSLCIQGRGIEGESFPKFTRGTTAMLQDDDDVMAFLATVDPSAAKVSEIWISMRKTVL